MKVAKKLLSAIVVLTMVATLFTGAMASGDPSGEIPVISEKTTISESVAYPDGVTIGEGAGYEAADGYCVIMTVDGQVLTQAAGTYAGSVVFEVVPLTQSSDGSQEFQTQSILTKVGDELITADSALNGTYDENGISGADITADQADMSIVTVVNSEYRIDDSTFHILQTGNHESGGNDFTGDGCAVAVTGASTIFLNNVTITGDGVTRTALFGGLSTHDAYPTVYVSNSTLTSTGDLEGEDCAVWVLGLHGVVRTCQYCDYYDNYYYNTTINSFGWASLSVDGTEAPEEDDLIALNDAYVEGEGYFNADGTKMTVADFAVAATGLTDEYLEALTQVESEDDLVALPQTNDESLYYFTGKNTLVDSELNITDMDEGRTGYSSYSIGSNINVYSNCLVNADYGNVEANEYASSAYINGTVVNARKSIVMCHSNAGGITFCSDATLNAGEIAFVYKGTGDGYTQESPDELAASSDMTSSATGSNLYVRNCKITAPVLVLTFDSDDPGALGGEDVIFDDSIAPKDESFDVTNADSWGPASTMWTSGGYNYNAAVQVYFQDCNGETALEGDIFNGHQFVSKNLVLTLDNTEITGIISSGWTEHEVDAINRYIPYGGDTYVGEDGLTYGERENLGRVTCHASETVNNGVIVTLTNGAVWNVTETSYVSVLNVDETSTVNGVITVLDSGIIRVDPVEGAAESTAAAGGNWDAYIAYLNELLDTDPGLDIYNMVKADLAAAQESDYTGMEDGTVFGVFANLYDAVPYEDFVG
jgi:hypothetical protein